MDSMNYIFPSYFYIKKASDLFVKTLLSTSTILLINTLDYCIPVFTINESIARFLSEFRDPCTLKQIQAKYPFDINVFFYEMVEKKFLICFASFNEKSQEINHCVDLDEKVKEFGDYIFVKRLNNKAIINVILVKDRNDKHYVIKYLEDSLSSEANSLHTEYLSLKILENLQITPRVIKYDELKKCLILEYIQGTTLLEQIQNKNLAVHEKLHIAERVITIMANLHTRNIVHGDIHAEQFIVDYKGTVFLLDFGYSYLKEQTDIINIICGGIYKYIEPENLKPNVFRKYNDYVPSFNCDVYRIGVLLYYLFWERFPHEGYTWKEFCKKVKYEEPQFEFFSKNGNHMINKYITLIKGCLSKDASSRPESAIVMSKMMNYY